MGVTKINSLKVGGWLGERVENNRANRLFDPTTAYAYLDYYENPVETMRWFRGEHMGKVALDRERLSRVHRQG